MSFFQCKVITYCNLSTVSTYLYTNLLKSIRLKTSFVLSQSYFRQLEANDVWNLKLLNQEFM